MRDLIKNSVSGIRFERAEEVRRAISEEENRKLRQTESSANHPAGDTGRHAADRAAKNPADRPRAERGMEHGTEHAEPGDPQRFRVASTVSTAAAAVVAVGVAAFWALIFTVPVREPLAPPVILANDVPFSVVMHVYHGGQQ